MIRQAAAGLAVVLILAGCAPAPSPAPTALGTPEAVASPPSRGATVSVEASGRYVCDGVVGCGAFVAFEPTVGLATNLLPDGWMPTQPYPLAEQPVPVSDKRISEVGDARAPIPPLEPGTYLVTAGWLWVSDTASTTEGPFAPNVFVRSGQNGVCQQPLLVDESTERVSVGIEFHEDTYCVLEIHAGSGARLDVEMAGTVHCTLFPYSCAAYLSVLPIGTVVDATWRPNPQDPSWGATTNGGERLDAAPVWTVPDLPVGRHRLLISLLGRSDVVSYAPDGQVARDLLSKCYLDVEVTPETQRVGIVATFTPDGSQWGGSCTVALAE